MSGAQAPHSGVLALNALQTSVFLPVYKGSEQKCVLFMLLFASIFFLLDRESHLLSHVCFPLKLLFENTTFQGITGNLGSFKCTQTVTLF